MQEAWAMEAPDGLAGGAADFASRAPVPHRRNRARDGVAPAILAHLPLAVAVIDRDARLLFWNEHAALLFNAPPTAADARPDLEAVLPGASNVSSAQRERIVAFAMAHIASGDRTQPEGCLRLSLGRGRHIAVQVHGLGAGRWMLVLDDGKVTAAGDPAALGTEDAWVDALTGVSNRRHFNRMLQEVQDAARVEASHAVLLIDLDRFAPVNAAFGQPVGDALLCLVARRLRREIRDVDLLARLGGDEFAILIASGDSAEVLAARAIAILSKPFLVDGQRVTIGASVGVVRFPDHGIGVDDVMRHAELALYEAKSAGGGAWRGFDAATAKQIEVRRDLETALRKALALGELSLVYQAWGDAESQRLIGFKARLRWDHPDRGVLEEAAFLIHAEATGCICALGEWKLRTACADAAQWPAASTVAVRICAAQMRDGPRLVTAVRAALDESRLEAGRLQLMVAEAALDAPGGETLLTLQRLRALGVDLALADFTIGPGSLERLQSFPFSGIVIEKGSVSGAAPDAGDATVLRVMKTAGFDRIQCLFADSPAAASAIAEVERRYSGPGHCVSATE